MASTISSKRFKACSKVKLATARLPLLNRINGTGQVPITQEYFNLLTRVDGRGARRQALRDGITTDAVATPKDG